MDVSPLGAMLNGALSGLFATFVLSILVRLLPGFQEPKPPGRDRSTHDRPEGITPAGALVTSESPGPEGLAQQFAFKVASGLFGRDVSPHSYALGLLTHFVYGSWWGAVFGILQGTFSWPVILFGAIYGLFVWLIGPVLLVPAMKLMGHITEEPRMRTAMLAGGHIVYGVVLALSFEHLPWRQQI